MIITTVLSRGGEAIPQAECHSQISHMYETKKITGETPSNTVQRDVFNNQNFGDLVCSQNNSRKQEIFILLQMVFSISIRLEHQ